MSKNNYQEPVDQLEDFPWDDADQDAMEKMPLSFPTVLWRNGDAKLTKYKDTLDYTGGFFFPYDACGAETTIPGWSDDNFTGNEGEPVLGLSARTALISIVRYRRRWQVKTENRTILLPWNEYQAGLKLRGRMQAVGFIKGYPEPVSFSFAGMTINWITTAMRDHYNRIIAGIVNRTAPKGKAMPPYAVWAPISAGKHVKSGKTEDAKEITPPFLNIPKTLDIAWARQHFIGKELLIRSQDLYRELDEWAHEWDRFENRSLSSSAGSRNDAPPDIPTLDDYYPPEPVEDGPVF